MYRAMIMRIYAALHWRAYLFSRRCGGIGAGGFYSGSRDSGINLPLPRGAR